MPVHGSEAAAAKQGAWQLAIALLVRGDPTQSSLVIIIMVAGTGREKVRVRVMS